MKLLIVAATLPEIKPLLTHFNFDGKVLKINDHTSVDVLITDAGIVATAFAMGQHLAHQQYDLAINLGIAGSFDRDLALGDVVWVTEDTFADWGAEDGDHFLSIDQLGFGQSVQSASIPLNLPPISLKQVRSITVNKVHGNSTSITQTVNRLNPQVESMEGAAFFYACNKTATPCIQVRSISNYVEPRNRDAWAITLAVETLNKFAIHLLNDLAS